MAAGEEEKKPVTQDELKAGVRLTAGHRVVLIVEGAVEATTTEAPGEPETTEPPATTTAEPAATTTSAATTTEAPSTTTTAAPDETTTGAPEETTTAAAGSTTTTVEPTSSTTSPGTTTTGEPSSTTTAPPSTTTAAPSSTTTAPGTTTTKAPGAQVLIELHADALGALPDGALVLSGDGVDEQQVTFADAEQADGVLRFKFQWDDASKKVKLVVSGGGNSITLWDDQPAGDPSQTIAWSGAVSDLFAAPADEAGEPEDLGSAPDDLHLLAFKDDDT